VPVVLLEQNAHPGRAVRVLARRATCVAASFEETRALLPRARVTVTGNPVRSEFRTAPPLGERPARLLVMGGSQGARTINRAVAACAADLLAADPELRIVHQCGRLDEAEMHAARERLDSGSRDRWELASFYADMAAQIAGSDLVVMRAGGSSLAEVSAMGRPMILIPYPHAGDHQRHNAAPYVDGGAALLLRDDECDGARLNAAIRTITGDRDRWCRMAERSRTLGRPDATDRVVGIIRSVAGGA
jgi:UDP-N-acetylglucosamine--N-acetylmuramyl-(pentapeptide) pyrophosphoryl-undecaprenol N-acetylglucosamine transferase